MLSDRCPVCLSVCHVCDVGVLWPNGWTDQDETWHAGRPRPWKHCVRWRPSSPPQKGAQPPNFLPIYIAAKLLHGSRCHLDGGRPRPRQLCVRWRPRFPSLKRGRSPEIFGPCLLWPNGLMHQDGTWHGGGPWSRPHCARWGPTSPPQKRGRAPLNFWPIFARPFVKRFSLC